MDFGVMDWFKGQKDSDRTFMIALVLFGLYYFGKKQKEKKEAEVVEPESPPTDFATEFPHYSEGYPPESSPTGEYTQSAPQYTAPQPPPYNSPPFNGQPNGGNRQGFARGSGYNQPR